LKKRQIPDGPPRFKQNQRVVHEVFLNDKATFKCTALARPAPKIHWYRNGEFLNYTMLSRNERLRENKKHFSLEIRRVEVGDQGSWTCKVWNQAGSIFRNFTLEIIDFCDYFLMDEYPSTKVPEKCICLWFLSGEHRKEGIDWGAVSEDSCDNYRKYALKMRKPFGKKLCANAPCSVRSTAADDEDESEKTLSSHESSQHAISTSTVSSTSADAVVLHGIGLHESVPNNFMHEHYSNALEESVPTTIHRSTHSDATLQHHSLSILSQHVAHQSISSTDNSENNNDAAAKRLRTRTVLLHHFDDSERASIADDDDDIEEAKGIAVSHITDSDAVREHQGRDDHLSENNTVDGLVREQEGGDNEFRPVEDHLVYTRKDGELPFEMPVNDEPSSDNQRYRFIHHNRRISTLFSSSTLPPTTTTSTTARPTTRLSFPPQKVPPYFKVRDEDAATSVITPSGRTIKLQCKAGGQPEPQVIWFNSNKKVITTEARRPVGAEFRLRKNTLEMEDVAESDSGDYTCEAFNSAGSVTRTFKLRVVDRMRSKPIIVPNILINQTVDANSTVNFTCKVISDLTPHIVWMRIELTNDSIYYWNATDRKYVFRYTDMRTVENAFITKTSQDSSTLTIVNVTMADQGMYACVSGNHLGHAIANATLTVNEFHALTLATGDPESEWSWISILALIICIVLLTLLICAALLYVLCVKRNSKTHIAQMEQLIPSVKKRVVITKPAIDPSEADGWSDMPSTYQIHIEPITSSHRRPRLPSDLTLLSDYEIQSDPAWEVDRSRLRFVDMLGEGAFGEVWKAILKPPPKCNAIIQNDPNESEMPVAIKKLKASAHEKELIDLVSEMETFKIIGHHENLLRLIGCCTGAGPLYVILELCKHGNLRDFLRAHRPRDTDSANRVVQDSPALSSEAYLEPRKPSSGKVSLSNSSSDSEGPLLIKNLTQRHLVQFAWQVAKGMEFMAARKIIHRDLAARNVLVGDNFVMKISDFGLSRDVHYNDYYRKKGNGRLPIKWMALEALDSHVYTMFSDVWSFGILLWEIMTLGGTPYPSIAMQQLYSCLKEGYRMEAPDNCPDAIYTVMLACWQECPERRPSFVTLVDYFDWILTNSAKDNEHYLEVQSISNEDGSQQQQLLTDNDEEMMTRNEETSSLPSISAASNSLVKRSRKIRPLSEPVIYASEVIDDFDSEVNDLEDCDCAVSRPLLSGATKAVVYTPEDGPAVQYAFVRRSGIPLPVPDPITSSLSSAKKLNSTATMSVDSAIGSPSWPIDMHTSMLLDGLDPYRTPSDSNEHLNATTKTPHLASVNTNNNNSNNIISNTSNNDIVSNEATSTAKEDSDNNEGSINQQQPNFFPNNDQTNADNATYSDDRLQSHYTDLAHENGSQKGKLFQSMFPFPPQRHTRFSDSSAYEPDAVQLSMLNNLNTTSTTESYAPVFNATEADTLEKSMNRGALNDLSSQSTHHAVVSNQRRHSVDSSSSGRGGSSGMSSAEGLGGIADFCHIECVNVAPTAHKGVVQSNSVTTSSSYSTDIQSQQRFTAS
uniref:Myoblast growth factor receptor egl-15 (inferred by orthology to a C. elegans protein) n=1 Tax=Anisakis simplex TaxID=6269 RepID=A0A0M3JTR1_ANISI